MGEEGSGIMNSVWDWLAINGIRFLVDLTVVVIILVVGKLLIDWCCRSMREAMRRTGRVSELLEKFVLSVVSKLLWIVVLMVAVKRFDIDIGPLIAGLGVTGFIIGFAFQETLGNLASGMMIALNQPFTVGDYVEIGGDSGVVKDMNMMATTLHTADNKQIVAPNKNVWGNPITNYTALDTRRVDMTVGISYGSDIGKAKEVIMSTLNSIEGVLDDPAPTVAVVEMADSSVNLVVRPWVKTADYWTVYFAAQQGLKEALDANDIEIPFPQLDVHHVGDIPGLQS